MDTTEKKILDRIHQAGAGNAYTAKDFLDLANYEATKKTLLRLTNSGTLRRPLRGVYDYPRYSHARKGLASPSPDAIADAIARAHGWTLIPTGETALNLLGLSTQVPAQWRYFSSGPSKRYEWAEGIIQFKHRANKEMSGLSPKTALLVQALKEIGEQHLDEQLLQTLRSKLSPQDLNAALREARYVTTWVYECIKRLAEGAETPDA